MTEATRSAIAVAIGQRIRAARVASGMRQRDVAFLLSNMRGRYVSPLTVTRTEGGKRPLPVDELVAIAAILNVHPADLLPRQEWF